MTEPVPAEVGTLERRRPEHPSFELEQYRGELRRYCRRILGSGFEAEDAVQETLLRAWRSLDTFEGRSSLRTWLYRIATNVCLGMLSASQRRAPPVSVEDELRTVEPAGHIEPPDAGDPASVAVARESIRLAFVAALQSLSPGQRAVLILREVLHWRAAEVAELLGTTVISVNSALQRARAGLATRRAAAATMPADVDVEERALLTGYVEAFERSDIDGLVGLLREDASVPR